GMSGGRRSAHGVAVWVAVQRRAAPCKEDRSITLVQLEPIGTAQPRAANAAGGSASGHVQPDGPTVRRARPPVSRVFRQPRVGPACPRLMARVGVEAADRLVHRGEDGGPGPGLARQPFRRVSGLNEPETPLYPAAQTIAAPGLADTDVSWLALPTLGLGTV